MTNTKPEWEEELHERYTAFEFAPKVDAHGYAKLKSFLKETVGKAERKATELEKGRAILVMSEFVREKGEDYPLGKYLSMLVQIHAQLLPLEAAKNV